MPISISPLTILHTTCHTNWGGLERRIFNESCWMAERGHHIVIAAPPNTPLAIKSEKKCRESKKWQYIPIEFTTGSMAKDFFKLLNHFKKIRPDILNTHGNIDSKVALTAAATAGSRGKKSGIRCKILSRHISAHVKPSWYNKKLYGTLCDYVFTTAEYTTRHLISTLNLDPEKVLTMPSGILPIPKLPERESARKVLAQDLGIENSEAIRFIGFIGRVSPDKGVGDIVQAFLSVADNFPQHHLVIVGGGDNAYFDHLEEMIRGRGKTDKNVIIKEKSINSQIHFDSNSKTKIPMPTMSASIIPASERIHFIGFKEDVWPYLSAFDCNVLASATQFEGISQALLEAMFAKCPVIASDSGGTPEIITHGKTGLLFSPRQAEELADQLVSLINSPDLAVAMAYSAFLQVQTHHTIAAMGKRTLEIYSR